MLSIARMEKSVATNFISFNYSKIVANANWIMSCHKIILYGKHQLAVHAVQQRRQNTFVRWQQSWHLQWINVFQFRNNMRHHILPTVLATKTSSTQATVHSNERVLAASKLQKLASTLHITQSIAYEKVSLILFVLNLTIEKRMATAHHSCKCECECNIVKHSLRK